MTSQAATDTITDRDNLIQIAVEYLSQHSELTAYASETLYAYTEQQQLDTVYLVSDDDMEELGRRLEQNPDAYSRWCADTTAEVTTAAEIVAALPELRATGLDALRKEAGAAGDYLTCAACDHIADRIRDLLD